MNLRQKQSLFVYLIGKLIMYAYTLPGVEFTFGESFDDDGIGHMKNSNHYIRLAQDLNLFVDGIYIKDGSNSIYKNLGEKWESYHPLCRWGGRFGDANHFSLEHEGRK